jgi:hypothetical protein
MTAGQRQTTDARGDHRADICRGRKKLFLLSQ